MGDEEKKGAEATDRALRHVLRERIRATSLSSVAREFSCGQLLLAKFCADLPQTQQNVEWLRRRVATLLLAETGGKKADRPKEEPAATAA
jgi:hypothetical protein